MNQMNAWYRRFEQIINKHYKDWDDNMKTFIIQRKLTSGRHKRYNNYIISKKKTF